MGVAWSTLENSLVVSFFMACGTSCLYRTFFPGMGFFAIVSTGILVVCFWWFFSCFAVFLHWIKSTSWFPLMKGWFSISSSVCLVICTAWESVRFAFACSFFNRSSSSTPAIILSLCCSYFRWPYSHSSISLNKSCMKVSIDSLTFMSSKVFVFTEIEAKYLYKLIRVHRVFVNVNSSQYIVDYVPHCNMLTCSAWYLFTKPNPSLYWRNLYFHFGQLVTVQSNGAGVCKLTEHRLVCPRFSFKFLCVMVGFSDCCHHVIMGVTARVQGISVFVKWYEFLFLLIKSFLLIMLQLPVLFKGANLGL